MTGWELQLLDANRDKVAVLWNPFSGTDASSCVVTETVEAEDVLTFSTPNLAHKDLLLNDGVIHLLRLVNLSDPSEIRTYQIEHVDLIHESEQELLDIRATRIWMWLKNRYIYAQKREFNNMTLGTVFNELITGSGADAAFQLGTIEKENDIVDFFEINHHSVLWGMRQLCTKMGCEMGIDESFYPIKLNFPTAIGNANSVARLRYGTNLQGIRKSVSRTKQATRLYGVGGGTPPLTLSNSDKSAPNHLAYLDDPTYDAVTNNYTDVYNNPDLENIENLILPQENPDFSGTYVEGLIEEWIKIGDPDVFENTSKQYIEHGTKSQKIVAGKDEGLRISILIPEEARNKNLVFWMHFFIETIDPLAVIQMEFDSGSGTYKFRAGEEAVPASSVPSTGGFYSIERRNIKTPLESCTLRIYSEGGPATFYLDAAFLGVGDEFKKFVIGDMADVLYDECVAELDKRNTPEVTYVVDALDLYETDPKKWADYQFRLGDDVTVEDLKVGIITKQRVKSRTWNVLYPEQSGFQVGNIIRTQAMQAANNALQFRDIIEQTRNSQGRSDANGRAGVSNSPPSSQPARYSKAFTSTSYNSLSYEGGGVVTIGSDLTYTLPGTSGSFTGLTENLSYYLYFDMNSIFDDPPAPFGITNNIDETMVSQRAIVAYVETGANGDPGLSIITAGRPQLSGDHLITGQIDANKCVIESPGNLPIHINGTGIYSGSGYGNADSTFGISNTNGVTYFEGILRANSVMTAPVNTDDMTTTVTPTPSSVVMDQTGVKGYDAASPTPNQRFYIKTDGTGWLGNETTGIKWENDGTLEIGTSVKIGSAIDNTALNAASTPDHSAVIIDNTGIKGFHYDTGSQTTSLTFNLNTDGSGQLGKSGENPIEWGSDGKLEVPGGIITSGIDADNITTGTLTIGPDTGNKMELAWSTGDFVLYKGGNQVLDMGTISGSSVEGDVGVYIADPSGLIYVLRDGAVGSHPLGVVPTGIGSNVNRNNDGDADTVEEAAYLARIFAATRTSGTNGDMIGYRATVENNDGKAFGFQTKGLGALQPNGVEGTNEATGAYFNLILAADNSGVAYGTRIDAVTGGTSTGIAYGTMIGSVTGGASTGGKAYGLFIEDNLDAHFTRAIHSESTDDSYLAGKLIVDGDVELTVDTKGLVGVPESNSDGNTINDDVTKKRLRIVKNSSAPTTAAYIAFTNNPGSDTFYLILEDA